MGQFKVYPGQNREGESVKDDAQEMVQTTAAERGTMLGDTYNVDLAPDAINRVGGLERFTGSDPVDECCPVGDRRDEASHVPQYKGGK